MIEVLDPGQPWQIPLPYTWEDHDRRLEARCEDVAVGQWRYDHRLRWWADIDGARILSYVEIVELCMSARWQLWSLPAGEATP